MLTLFFEIPLSPAKAGVYGLSASKYECEEQMRLSAAIQLILSLQPNRRNESYPLALAFISMTDSHALWTYATCMMHLLNVNVTNHSVAAGKWHHDNTDWLMPSHEHTWYWMEMEKIRQIYTKKKKIIIKTYWPLASYKKM